MFDFFGDRARVVKLEEITVPKLQEEMAVIATSVDKISSQMSTLICLVAVSGVVGSPELVKTLVSSLEPPGAEVGWSKGKMIGAAEMMPHRDGVEVWQ